MNGVKPRRDTRRQPALRLGATVRSRRQDRGLTLVEVATRTGLSIGFLSQVERDITTPSLSSLALIAEALGTRIHDFIEEPPPVALHTHDAEGRVFAIDPRVIAYERLSGAFTDNALNAIKMIVPPGYRSEVSRHEGEEFVFVLAGSIRYALSGEPFDLVAGDSLHFSSTRPHHVENLTAEPAEVLTVVTQDLFGERAAQNRGKARGSAASRRKALPRHGLQDVNDQTEVSK
jgi:transcriptional regulator with XRE-family HTH domain